jgi:uncharacterized protein (TIGR03437 family)
MKTRSAILSFPTLIVMGVALCQAQTPTITAGGILNGASFASGQPLAPGSLVSIFGTNLANSIASADTVPLSNTLGGVLVQFENGATKLRAPMLFVQNGSNSQINVQVPWGILPGGATATVKVVVSNNGKIATGSAQVGPFSPGVFAANGLAVAVNFSDGTLAWPAGSVPGLTTHPAKAGEAMVIYATGLGAVDHPPADGHNTGSTLATALTKPQVLIGGVAADVIFAGLSPQFVGVNQLNITVPNAAPGNKVPLQISVGGITSPDTTTIAIEP